MPAAPEMGHDEESPQRTAPEVVQVLRERVGDLEKQVEMLGTDKEELRQDKEKLWKQVEHYQRLLPPPEEGEISEDKQEKQTIKVNKETVPVAASTVQKAQKKQAPKAKSTKKRGFFRRMFGGGK